MTKTAIITGITGQDGSFLADQLLEKGYKVYGLRRRSSSNSLGNAAHLASKVEFVNGDLNDLSSLIRLCSLARADEFYHLAAQSHVGISFEQPLYTVEANAIGTFNCLEAVRLSGIHTRFYHAATSELFGGLTSSACNEDTPFHPRSPYGVAKLAGFWATVNYRESYKMFACNGILFNHESRRRPGNFVSRKITQAVAAISCGKQEKLYLGNLDAMRDWGDAEDYVEAMNLMLNYKEPGDYVVATGETHSVREFCELAFIHAGLGDYSKYVEIDPAFYRPAEVNILLGDPSKAKSVLGWEPRTKFADLVRKMVEHDLGLI